MRRRSVWRLLLVVSVVAAAGSGRAEVKTEEKSLVKFEGMIGRMMGLFGGKAAKEGIVSTVAVKGNRKLTMSDYGGEIIDLDERKIYTLDAKKKTYEVVSFEEMRRRMQEAQEKAAKAAKEETKQEKPAPEKQMEIDFSLKETGQKRTINGYDCREVVMTITAREKGKTLEEGGGMVMTSHVWLGPAIAALKEIADFDLRYYKALAGPAAIGGSAEQMATALAMYPAMKEVMGRMQVEKVNMEGAQILTESTMEAVRNPQESAEEGKREKESTDVTSIRGIGGLLGRKIARKKEEDPGQPKNRATVFSMTHELLKASSTATASDVAIPAGFREKK